MPHQFAERVDALVDSDASRLVTVFKDIHRHPELGFAETRTAGIVAQALTELGFAVRAGIAGTGVAAILSNGSGPTVMYRADMDALPVEEATGLDYASTVRISVTTAANHRWRTCAGTTPTSPGCWGWPRSWRRPRTHGRAPRC